MYIQAFLSLLDTQHSYNGLSNKTTKNWLTSLNKTHVSVSKELQTPLETVQNCGKTFGVRKERLVKAQPEMEGINNSYQG